MFAVLKVSANPSANIIARIPEQMTHTLWHIIKSLDQIQNSIHQLQLRLSGTENRVQMLSSSITS